MLKSVYQAPNEFAAITIMEMLKSQGLECVLRGRETTWLNGLPTVLKGYWGEVLVREEDYPAAEECVREFLTASENQTGSDSDQTDDLE